MGCGSSKQEKRRSTASGLRIVNKGDSKASSKLEAKIVLVGSQGVGKTCIATTYKEGKFTSEHKPTVGASYFQKNFAFPDGTTLKLHIWDTAGQERYQCFSQIYLKDATLVIIMYDTTSKESFTRIK